METKWLFYTRVNDAWDAMYEACAAAEKQIDFETYIFRNDSCGKKFLKMLSEKAKSGVRVRLLVDLVGSINLMLTYPLEEFSNAGIEIKFFNLLSPWETRAFGAWFFRDHRKILVVDGAPGTGFTGGIGINEAMENWRDTQVSLRGPVVGELASAFERMWKIAHKGKYLPMKMPSYESDGFGFFTNAPHPRQRFFYYEVLGRMRKARDYIYITTPYFIPDRDIFRAMIKAARSKTDVRLLICKHSDLKWIDTATSYYFAHAMKAGIKIYQYRHTVMHAKTIVIDGKWSGVGSANIDNLGLLFNHEGNLLSENARFAHDLREQFMEDFGEAERLDPQKWALRPLWKKIIETATRPIHMFL